MSKILFVYLYVFVYVLSAQTLTLDECIEKTLNNHPDLTKASLEVLKSKEGVDIAKADYLPQINASAIYNPVNTFVMPQNGRFNTIEDSNWQASLRLEQKIYDFGKTASLVSSYKKALGVASLGLEDTKALLAYRVKGYFNTALLQQHTITSRIMDVKTKEELYKQSLALVKEGLKTEADSATMNSALLSAQEELGIARSELKKALNALSLYTGESIEEDVILKEPPYLQGVQNIKELTSSIEANNISLKSLEEETLRAESAYKAVKAQEYGSLDALAAYSYQDSINSYDTTQIGVALNIPLYSGGRLSAQNEQARIAKEISKASVASKKLQLKEQAQNLLADLQRQMMSKKAKEAAITASLEAKNIVEARYKEGLATYIEALDANGKYLDAEIGLERSIFYIRDIINQLDYLQGQLK